MLVVAVPALAQSYQSPAADSARSSDPEASISSTNKPKPKPPAKRWDQLLKDIPIAGTLPLKLSLGGQARWRGESFRAFNLGPANDDNSQSRLSLSADLAAGNPGKWHSRIFIEGRDAQSYGRNLPGGARPSDEDRHDLQSLYVDAGYAGSFIRYGRQEISFNRDRLIGVPDWSNTRRGSQGLRAQFVRGAFALELTDFRPVIVRQTAANRADSTTTVRTVSLGSSAGAKPLAPGLPAFWQAYTYEQRIRLNPSSPLTRRITTGGRVQWQWGKSAQSAHAQSIEVEGARQSGRVGNKAIAAWFWVAEGQWQWKQVHGKPSLSLGIDMASGERASTPNRIEAFNVLYPAGHSHGGYADVIGRQNARELHLIGAWDPAKALNLRVALYRFDRLRLDDGIYNKQNSLLRAQSNSQYRHAADEMDITGTWKLHDSLKLLFGGAIVAPGPFLRKTPPGASTERWGFIGSTFSF